MSVVKNAIFDQFFFILTNLNIVSIVWIPEMSSGCSSICFMIIIIIIIFLE